MSIAKTILRTTVNGSPVEVLVRPYDVLLDVLREQLRLVGTKRGCDMGTCGCCTVLIDGRPRMSCLVLALEAEGGDVTTIEGIRDAAALHPLQECWAAAGASQCGFCSPGFIMAAKRLCDTHPDATRDEILEAIDGNVCRCTGYVKIVEAIENGLAQVRARRDAPPAG